MLKAIKARLAKETPRQRASRLEKEYFAFVKAETERQKAVMALYVDAGERALQRVAEK